MEGQNYRAVSCSVFRAAVFLLVAGLQREYSFSKALPLFPESFINFLMIPELGPVTSVVAKLEASFTDTFAAPPQQLVDLLSFLPDELQLKTLPTVEGDFPVCLHTPPTNILLEDAKKLYPLLRRLKERTFFRIFKLRIMQRSCSSDILTLKTDKDNLAAAMQSSSATISSLHPNTENSESEICTSPELCGLCKCSDDEVPPSWKDKPEEDFVDRRHAASFYRWKESSLPPDAPFSKKSHESSSENEPSVPPTYVDLMRNPPGFTNYQGGPIWSLLRDNIQRDMKKEIQDVDAQTTIDECGEAANLGRVISGVQANISALAGEYYYMKHFNVESEDEVPHVAPAPNLSFFVDRFSKYRERIFSLYFTFSLLLKGVCKLTDILQECSCETGNSNDDLAARADLLQILNAISSHLGACRANFNVPLFRPNRLSFLDSPENISALLRCVSCEKCQLHGTIKLTALRLAAKSATEGVKLTHLERNEVTALVNALYYFADSILAVERMRFRVSLHNALLLAIVLITFVLILVLLCRHLRSSLSSSANSTVDKKNE